jgi:uncharacterized protein
MLTGRLLRARLSRNRVLPAYLDTTDASWLEAAERLLGIFRGQEGRTRGALEEEVRECFGSDPAQLIYQGLAKLLGDRCEFEVVSGCPPEQLRDEVFRTAAAHRRATPTDGVRPPFRREPVLAEVAERLGLTPETVEQGLFADLKSEQRLVRFRDITAQRLLERYNVALAQAVLLRSTGVHVTVRGEAPARYRQLFRQVKFHRLVCEIGQPAPDCYRLHLDGPLSLFAATQKYGLQLALFLPAVLLCRDFDLHAALAWGPRRKPATFTLTPSDGLVSHYADTGMYVPPELAMFVELFRKKVADWDIDPEAEVFPLGDGFWVPDFRLTHRPSGRGVLLEVLGFWRRSSALRHLERLRSHAQEPFILAVSDQLHVEEAGLEGLPALIHRFRQMPLPEEVVRLAVEILATHNSA